MQQSEQQNVITINISSQSGVISIELGIRNLHQLATDRLSLTVDPLVKRDDIVALCQWGDDGGRNIGE